MIFLKGLAKGFVRLLALFSACGAIGAIVVAAIFFYISLGLPKISSLADYHPPVATEIYSSDGQLLLEVAKEKRSIAGFDEIPQVIIDALISAEDDKFFEHSGVDYWGVFRAMLANFKAGRVVQGGSTITQQVAKSLLLTSERSYARKIKDFLLAQRIEEKFSKKDILFLYLNQMYLGGGYYGVKAAAKGYFDKELHELTIAESALLAGLLAAPGRYSPYVKPIFGKRRQNYVLGRMFATGKITKEEYEASLSERIKMRIRKPKKMQGGHFTDWVRQRVIAHVGAKRFLTEGFKIITSIDWELQKTAEDEVLKGVKAIDKRQGFKGPLSFLNIDEFGDDEEQQNSLVLYEQGFRKKTYRADSNFFYFNNSGEIDYEYLFDEEEYNKILAFRQIEKERKLGKYFEIGTTPDDPLAKFIKTGKSYKAVVTKVNDFQRTIYVSIGGVKGVIPYENFRWAHERNISDERKYFSYVTRPTSIVKKGDVILVTVLKSLRSPWFYLHSAFKNKITNEELVRGIKRQRFFICMLDQEPDVEGALLSIVPQTGKILAMVGGSDFAKNQFNRAIQSQRQPGSAFKPFIYAAGLENGFTSASILIDSPSALGGADSSLNWKPRNYDGKFAGEMTFRIALEKSRNVPTIKLAETIGVKTITEFAKRIGIDSELPQDLSISLGSFGITLYDLVSGYAIFPMGGKTITPTSIVSVVDRDGNEYDVEVIESLLAPTPKADPSEELEDRLAAWDLSTSSEEEKKAEESPEINIYTQHLTEKQVYDERLAYLMISLLKGVVQDGTGRSVKDVSPYLGAKTGTTNNFVDAWFVGFSSNIVTGVWTGFDNNKTMGWAETGAKAALPIWKGFMSRGLTKLGEYDFIVPSGIVNVMIDKESGKLLQRNSKRSYMEAFVEGTEPQMAGEDDGEEEMVEASSSLEIGQEAPMPLPKEEDSWDDDDYFSKQ